MINATMSSRKKFYHRWDVAVIKEKLTKQCKSVNSLFQSLNFSIKSVADNAFVD